MGGNPGEDKQGQEWGVEGGEQVFPGTALRTHPAPPASWWLGRDLGLRPLLLYSPRDGQRSCLGLRLTAIDTCSVEGIGAADSVPNAETNLQHVTRQPFITSMKDRPGLGGGVQDCAWHTVLGQQ